MYTIDEKDKVIKLNTLPQSSVGAPIPLVLSGEHSTVIAYYIQEKTLRSEHEYEPVAMVKFKWCHSTMFGAPNDEAFNGHPLWSRGLRPYGFFEIENSSWVRTLEKMNSVHPYHSAEHFKDYKHFVVSFHDTTFECVCKEVEYEIVEGPVYEAVEVMINKLK